MLVAKKILSPFPSLLRLYSLKNIYLFARITQANPNKINIYQQIKKKDKSNKPSQVTHIIPTHEHENIQHKNHYRCDGCNNALQSEDPLKYGYIDKKIYQESVKSNATLISDVYSSKAKSKDEKVLKILHEVQKETGREIFNKNDMQLQNLDKVDVLMKLQDKIDQYQEDQQFLKRNKKQRKTILCYRCYNLKHYNYLPEQYDYTKAQGTQTFRQDVILDRLFMKHKNVPKNQIQFLYILDVFDIAGSFQQNMFQKVIKQGYKMVIVVNKIDIINNKYLNKTLLQMRVHHALNKFIQKYEQKTGLSLKKQQIPIFFMSSKSRDGIKKFKQHLEKSQCSKIQLFGYPNTGKTTLLNTLIYVNNTISKIPGTTTEISKNPYGKGKFIYDMPGIYNPHLMYNLIEKMSTRSLLTWHKFYSPALLTHSAIIYGGKIQLFGARIIVVGLGGAINADNEWFLNNYKQFWKGLPPLQQLKIKRYEVEITFENGKTDDLQIEGYGFIAFRLCEKYNRNNKQKVIVKKKLTFYLPQTVKYSFAASVLSDSNIIHNTSAIKTKFMLQRLKPDSKERRGRTSPTELKKKKIKTHQKTQEIIKQKQDNS